MMRRSNFFGGDMMVKRVEALLLYSISAEGRELSERSRKHALQSSKECSGKLLALLHASPGFSIGGNSADAAQPRPLHGQRAATCQQIRRDAADTLPWTLRSGSCRY
jgi:hypothetical protein